MAVYACGTGAFCGEMTPFGCGGFRGWERTPLMMAVAGKGGGGVEEVGMLLLTPVAATVNESAYCCGCWGWR